MTRKEHRAKMRAKHGPDWWKKSAKSVRRAESDRRLRKAVARAVPWNDRSLWPEDIGDAFRMIAEDEVRYGYQDDDGRITVVIKETGPNSYRLKGEAESNWLWGLDDDEIERKKMTRRGLTRTQAIKAVKGFVG